MTSLFSLFEPNVHSPFFQIPLAILCCYFFVALTSWKFGFQIFRKQETNTEKKLVPWGLGVAFAMFVVFAIVGPVVGGLATKAMRPIFPDFGDQVVCSDVQANDEVNDGTGDEANDTINDTTNDAEKPGGENNETFENLPEENKFAENDKAAISDDKQDVSNNVISEQQNETNAERAAEESVPTETPRQDQEEREVQKNTADVENETQSDEQDLSTQHPVARMLVRAKKTPYFATVLLVFLFSVVVLAPITEELIFRVILQSACERTAFERYLDRLVKKGTDVEKTEEFSNSVWRKPYVVLLSILPAAIVFALLHFSTPEDPNKPELVSKLFRATVANIVGNTVVVAFCVCYLKKIFHARNADLGLGALSRQFADAAPQLLREFFRGMVLFVFCMPFVYIVKTLLQTAVPNMIVDPVPILIFALFEGVVYYRTHSYPTVVGIHFGLNATSALFLLLAIA